MLGSITEAAIIREDGSAVQASLKKGKCIIIFPSTASQKHAYANIQYTDAQGAVLLFQLQVTVC